MIDFFALPVSAYCAKVRIALDIKRIEYNEIPPPDGYGSEAYRAIVPAGSIPAIRDGDFVLHDSDAILEYLEDRYPEPAMRSNDLQKRAHLRAIARFHDTALEPTVRALFPLIGKPAEETGNAIATAAANINSMLRRLEALVEKTAHPSPFLGGDQMDLADCSFAPTIQMAERLLDHLGEQLESSKIQSWMQALNNQPEVMRSLDICRCALEDWVASKAP